MKDLIVTEAVVWSVTIIDDKLSLPISVEYTPELGKNGEKVEKMFKNHIKVIQMCRGCDEDVKDVDLVQRPKLLAHPPRHQ